METRNTGALWLPPTERIEAIADVLHSHWSRRWRSELRYHLTNGGRLIRYASGSASVLKPNFVPRS